MAPEFRQANRARASSKNAAPVGKTRRLRARCRGLSVLVVSGDGDRLPGIDLWSVLTDLDTDVGYLLQEVGQVPVPVAQELHRSRHEYRAHDGGVQQDRHGHAEAELLELDQVSRSEA